MKALRVSLFTIAFTTACFSLVLNSARADKMDESTHTEVMSSLERVLNKMSPNSGARVGITQRLADLYAERSRLAEMKENEANCDVCKQAKEDRVRALQLYESIFSKVKSENKTRVMLQMAHLYQLTEQTPKAFKLYQDVVKQGANSKSETVGLAYTGIGEIQFRQAKFKAALESFNKALEIRATPRPGFVKFRIAWCLFNMDKLKSAIQTLEHILRTPALTLNAKTRTQDVSFREEVSRDFATFISRSENVTQADVNKVAQLTPESNRDENLNYFASELDRLGKKTPALMVWGIIGNQNKEGADRIEGQIRLAQLQYDINKKKAALVEYEGGINYWIDKGCEGDRCDELRSKYRKFVTDWGKADEEEPTVELLKVYQLYTSAFEDVEVNYWGALVAKKLSKWNEAIQLYRNASELSKLGLSRGQTGKQKISSEKLKTIFEGSLLGEIEVAEISKDNALKDRAYDHYLEVNPNGVKNVEVRYQKAHILYEKNDYKAAAVALRDLALSTDKNSPELKEKAADLSLDSLAILKDHERLEKWSLEFANVFPNRKNDFIQISRKSVINRAAEDLNNSKVASSRLESNLSDLSAVQLQGADDKEKITYFKNRLMTAEKLKNLTEVNRSADGLLAIKSLSKSDWDFAMSRKAWAAEMTLNFGLAYKLTEKMTHPRMPEDERVLKLAVFAELAGHNPDALYSRYIKITKNRKSAQQIMAKLVRRSSNPLATLRQYESQLNSNPNLLASLYLEIFARTKDYKFAEQVARLPRVRSTPSGTVFNRFIFLKDFRVFQAELSHSNLNSRSDADLKKSLKARLALLKRADQQAQRAIQMGDWTLQLTTLDTVARENQRLAQDIKNLPIPKNLNAAQRKEYDALVAQQIQPYLQKAKQVVDKIEELWGKSSNLDQLVSEFEKTTGSLRGILAMELRALMEVAPRSYKNSIASTLAEKGDQPSAQRIEEARRSVQENPFSVSKLERLRDLEERAGRDTHAGYFQARVNQLQGEVR